jgi:hypothetical protein
MAQGGLVQTDTLATRRAEQTEVLREIDGEKT